MVRFLLTALAFACALSAQPLSNDTVSQLQEASVRFQNGDLDGAEKLFTQLSRQNGEAGLSGADGLFSVLERRGKIRDGMEVFRKYYQRTGNLQAISRGALRLAENGLNFEAERELKPLFERLRKGENLPPNVSQDMATAERRMGNLEVSLEASRKAEEDLRKLHSPQWIVVGDFVAQTLEDLGRTLEALNEYEFILKEGGENAFILNNYAYHLAVHNKELPRALSMVQRSLVLDPGNGNALDTQGFILIKLGRTEEAIDAMVASWRRVPDEMVVRTHLAQALARRKSKSETMQNLLDVLRTEPDPENTAEIDRLLLAIGE